MQGAAALLLFLANARFCLTCRDVNGVLICRSIPAEFSPGYQVLFLVLENVGTINSTVFHRTGFSSITKLILDGSGVTEISENAFSSALQLGSVSLDRNRLSEMNPKWFRDPAVLHHLSLSENHMEVVNATALHGLTNLTELRLNKNRIRTINPDSFSSLDSLTEVDLSENRLTWLSPRLLRSLGSLRSIRLHGNPWACLCDAEDFVVSVRDLQNRSLLVQPTQVTCETPPTLKGHPVFNVTPCPSTTESATVLTSTEFISSAPSASEHSDRTEPDPLVTVSASSAQGTSSSWTPRTSMSPGIHVSSSSSVHSKPSFMPFTVLDPGSTELASSPPLASDSKIFGTLVSIIVLLSVLLCVVCFLVAMHRQKRCSKTVMPGCPEEDQEKQRKQDVSGSTINLSSQSSELRDPEVASRRCFRGDRARSAHAVILTAPFGVSGRDRVTLQTETEDAEKPQDRKQNPASVTEVGQSHLAALTSMDALKEHERAEGRRDLEENQQRLDVSTDVVPYLTIGRGHNKPGPDRESSEGLSPQSRKVMSRISTWPPNAAQWQARCKRKEEEEDEEFAVWTGGAAEETVKQRKPPAGPDLHSEEDENNQNSSHQKELQEKEELQEDEALQEDEELQEEEELQEDEELQEEEELQEDKELQEDEELQEEEELQEDEELQEEEEPSEKATGGTTDGIRIKHQQTSAGKWAHKSGKSSKVEAAPAKQSAANAAAGSKAPSGGTTPDDETLLSGNEYVFLNLLHEVAHNNGRWTRERWKQTKLNKQRLEGAKT